MSAISVQRRNPTRYARPILGLLAVVAIAATTMWILGDPGRRVAMETLLQSPMGLIGLFGLSALSSATLLLPVPGIALTVLAATIADPILVGLAAGLGQTVGELTGYLAGTSGGALAGERLVSSRMGGWMRRRGGLTLFVLGLIPNPAFDVAGILAGALRLPLATFLAATGCGKVLRNVLVAWAALQGFSLL